MDSGTVYITADGTQVPTPRRVHPSDVFGAGAYLAMRLSDAITDTCNLVYAVALSHRDAVDESTAFLREGLAEIKVLTSSKFLTSPEQFDAAIQQGIEDGYSAFEEDNE